MNEKTKKEIIQKIGIKTYLQLKPSINQAENKPNTTTYHVTNDKKILKNKKHIQKRIKNLKILTPTEWYKLAYKKLNKKQKKEIQKKLKNKIKKWEN